MGMAAFTDNNFLNLQIPGDLRMSDRHPGQLDIIVPKPVIHDVVPQFLGGKRPGNTGGLKDNGKSADILRPGKHLAGIMQQEDFCPLLIPGDLDLGSR